MTFMLQDECSSWGSGSGAGRKFDFKPSSRRSPQIHLYPEAVGHFPGERQAEATAAGPAGPGFVAAEAFVGGEAGKLFVGDARAVVDHAQREAATVLVAAQLHS